jgi:hypothetical protein
MAQISPLRRPSDREHDGLQSVTGDATIVPAVQPARRLA